MIRDKSRVYEHSKKTCCNILREYSSISINTTTVIMYHTNFLLETLVIYIFLLLLQYSVVDELAVTVVSRDKGARYRRIVGLPTRLFVLCGYVRYYGNEL